MAQTTTKTSVLDDVKDLRALREELRLQAHLFKAEAKDRFDALESRWREIQRIIQVLEQSSSGVTKEISAAAKKTLEQLSEQYRLLMSDLGKRR